VANDKSSNDRRLKVPQCRGTRVALRCWVTGELPCQLINGGLGPGRPRDEFIVGIIGGEGVEGVSRTIEAIVQFENPRKLESKSRRRKCFRTKKDSATQPGTALTGRVVIAACTTN